MSKLPETGPSLIRKLRQAQRQALRQAQSSAFNRSGVAVTAEDRVEVSGQMQSWDYDGTSRADLGAEGWMLGPDDGGPSFLALNGRDVFADLAAQQAALTTAQATLATTVSGLAAAVANIAAQTADLASRVTRTVAIASFSTPTLPNDSAWHNYGADISTTIAVPTGTLVVTVGCGEAWIIIAGAGAVSAQATFSISGGHANYGDVYAQGDASSSTADGMSLCVQHSFTVPPGTYTITGKMRAYASGTGTGSVDFNNPYLTVQVTG